MKNTDPIITWELRHAANKQFEAVAALADLFSGSNGIRKICSGNANDLLLEAESYARNWDIPFSIELTKQMILEMDRKRWDTDEDGYGDHHWISSSEADDC